MIKKIGMLPKIGKLKPIKVKTPKITEMGSELPELSALADLESSEVKDLRRILGDDPETEQLIKRVLALKEKEPVASLPELIAYDWLTRKDIPFTFQGSIYGGRLFRGGQIPDFIIPQGGMALAWRIQGEYWHSKPGAEEKDLVSKLRLLAGTLNGLQVSAVVDCWERDIYENREQVFKLALAGIGLRE